MGVTGLWRLIEPTGKPVPVETLENKVLAVDISIWLHQVVKGYQDAKGAPLPNAHLMGLFQRLCKLLYFRIKPVFVFDGGFPDLKKETIAKRQDNKSRYHSESERLKRELAILFTKKSAVTSLLGKQVSPKKGLKSDLGSGSNNDDDLFKLPALPERDESETESEEEESSNTSSSSIVDLHSVDLDSQSFKKLPVKEKYDLLVELKETRKMNSWGRIYELPKKSDNFSSFQMERLLKRRKVQECLEETEKEMGSTGMSLNDLECLLNDVGIDTKVDNLPTRRIASNDTTRFLLIENVKKTLADLKKKKENDTKDITSIQPEATNDVKPKLEDTSNTEEKHTSGPSNTTDVKCSILSSNDPKPSNSNTECQIKDELEEDLQKAIQMSLECMDEPNTSIATSSKADDSWTTYLTDNDYSESEMDSDNEFEPPDDMSCAKAYIMQYTDFTHTAIEKLVDKNQDKAKSKNKVPDVDKIINDLNKEKSIIKDTVDLSSSEEETTVSEIKTAKLAQNFKPRDKSNTDEGQNDKKEYSTNDVDIFETQASVLCIDTENEIMSLESTIDEETETNNHNIQKSKANEEEEIQSAIHIKMESNSDSDEFEEVTNENDTSNLKTETETRNHNIQKSKYNDEEEIESAVHKKVESESSSDSDDFEEVTNEKDSSNLKTVVELTLDMRAPPEDDIFADVFTVHGQNSHNTNARVIDKNIDEISQPIAKPAVEKSNIQNEEQNSLRKDPDVPDKNNLTKKATESFSTTREINLESKLETPHVTTLFADKDSTNDMEKDAQVIDKTLEPVVKVPLSTETLTTMFEDMQSEEQNILQEKSRLDRIGRNITEQMTKDAQELLQVFGIPYIVAPMEAEAQCAFLESVKLTDGTITDDSDIWLFGGKTVYKNFFNQKKHVLQFLSERIERSFNLTREQLILLALLVGSDYTTGITGVGPVTALEILASFPHKKPTMSDKQAKLASLITGLTDFKKWVRSGKRTDNTTLKKKLKNVVVGDDFPSVRVIQAYLEPNVEKSEERFAWGQIDITVLRDYARAKFGWSQHKLDEIIKPVLSRIQDRQSQRKLQDYFKRKIEFQSLEDQMSKRVRAAVQKMGPDGEKTEQVIEASSSKPKKTRAKRKPMQAKETTAIDETNGTLNTVKPPAKRKIKETQSEELLPGVVKVKTVSEEEKPKIFNVTVSKTNRYQEIIPQREKDKKCVLENKLKAIELFRKTTLDRKTQRKKRRVNLPKDKAELSESSDSN